MTEPKKYRRSAGRSAAYMALMGTSLVAAGTLVPAASSAAVVSHSGGRQTLAQAVAQAAKQSGSLPAPPAPRPGRPQIPAWLSHPGNQVGSAAVQPKAGSAVQPKAGTSVQAESLQAESLQAQSLQAQSPQAPLATSSSSTQVSAPGVKTWGPSTGPSTLVLYDTTGSYGFLGAMYALAAGNLAAHFGPVTAEPVVDYTAGQVDQYAATMYMGSTYNEPIPTVFLSDVQSTTHPVIWAGDNIWQLSGAEQSSSDLSFESSYGWDPSNSYFTSTSGFNAVDYKGQSLTRFDGSGADPILDPYLTDPAKVTILANASADPTLTTAYTTVPWAIRSGNLTYVGEIPLSYVSETDRTMAFDDLLFDALAPKTPQTRRAMVRLEDLNAADDQQQIRSAAELLHKDGIPFSFNVIPQYQDPNGYYNSGTPVSLSLAQSPSFVKTIKVLLALGGTMVDEGYTHQYSNIYNPYDGVTADDFEFYRAQCSPTDGPPYDFSSSGCPSTDYVIEEGPVPNDSASWATGRLQAARNEFAAVNLPEPSIFEFPHYAASMTDYQAAAGMYSQFYDRRLYFGASLTGGSADYGYGQVMGQFFPFPVRDVYGSTVIPENLGDYEPSPINHSPTRLPADIVHEAQLNTVVRDSVASFFYDPSFGTQPLQQIVSGITAGGYTFVSPAQLLANP